MMILKHNAYVFWITDTKHCTYLFELLQNVTKYLFREYVLEISFNSLIEAGYLKAFDIKFIIFFNLSKSIVCFTYTEYVCYTMK